MEKMTKDCGGIKTPKKLPAPKKARKGKTTKK